MKRLCLLPVLVLAACNAQPDSETSASTPNDPDPGQTLLTVFDAQDEGGNCVINYSVYVRADAGIKRVNTDLITGDIMGGGGLGLQDFEADDILKGSGFDRTIDATPCAQVAAASRPFQCYGDGESKVDCPPLAFDGTQAFASFEQKKW